MKLNEFLGLEGGSERFRTVVGTRFFTVGFGILAAIELTLAISKAIDKNWWAFAVFSFGTLFFTYLSAFSMRQWRKLSNESA